MALELLLKVETPYEYITCADKPAPTLFPGFTQYNGLCAGIKEYFESIAWIESFVYNAATDRYWLTTTNYISNWPGHSVYFLVIHPETGAVESRVLIGLLSIGTALTSTAYNGGLNKLYAFYQFGAAKIVEITSPSSVPTASAVANPVVTPTQIPILSATNFGFGVCPESKLITILSGVEGIVVYDYSAYPALATKKWQHPFPESFGWSMGYESDERIWALFSSAISGSSNSVNQTLIKYNYRYNRMELLSELQANVTPDRDARICFDTKRKKLAAFRVQADDANGAPNNSLEIYAPRPAMTLITVPVAITRLSPDRKIAFRSHLMGSKAEAGGMRLLSISNVEVDGIIIKDEVPTDAGGVAQFEYQTETPGLTDTLTVEYDETKVIV